MRGQRILDVVRVTAPPRDDGEGEGEGRHYLVERELTCKAELDALVCHYVAPRSRRARELRDENELLADLMAVYTTRREAGVMVIYPDLLAREAEFGERAAANFETLVVYWELKRIEGEA